MRVAWWAGAPVRAALIGLIRFYQITVGQGLLGGQCRFHPSCSSYAEAAIRELGWIRGVGLAIWRIARCNPFSAGGVEYPPKKAVRTPIPYDRVNNVPYDAVIHGAVSAHRGVGRSEVEGSANHTVQAGGGLS